MIPDTYFTAAPDWTWWIVPYFFVGGIAGGAYFISALLVWFGRPEDRPVIHTGFYLGMLGAVIGGILLVLDLGRPERFWHMLFLSEEFPALAFKSWSPISFGAWGLMGFGAIATASALGAAAEEGRFGLRPIPWLHRGPFWKALVTIGGFFGFFVAGYTGVLLTVTNRPVWADSHFLGMLFIASAASTAAATLILLGRRRFHAGTVDWLSRFDAAALVFELLVLVVFLATLGAAFEAWLGWWGVVLLLGVVVVGILMPLALHWRPAWFRGRLRRATARPKLASAILVLVGGFLLRLAVIMASHGIEHARVVRGALPGALPGVVLLLALAACSPEAERVRGGGPGADPGNRDPVVEIHAGARPYAGTPCMTSLPECTGPLPVSGLDSGADPDEGRRR